MSLLAVDNVSKHFRGLTAVDGVSFEVGEGEIFAVMSQNGESRNVISGVCKSA